MWETVVIPLRIPPMDANVLVVDRDLWPRALRVAESNGFSGADLTGVGASAVGRFLDCLGDGEPELEEFVRHVRDRCPYGFHIGRRLVPRARDASGDSAQTTRSRR
jgi:hypothetical protein